MSVPTLTILSSGKRIPDEWAVLEVGVRAEVNRIPTAIIVLMDGDLAEGSFPASESSAFDLAQEIEIRLRWEGETQDVTVFRGLVVRQGIEITDGTTHLTIEARDPAIKMTQVRKSRVFTKMADSDAISKVIREAGLRASVTATNVQHDSLVQYQCTDWDFVSTRAEAAGLAVSVLNGVVTVGVPKPGQGPKATFTVGMDDIVELECEADITRQWADLSAKGWTPEKQESSASKARPIQLGQSNWKPQTIAKRLGFTGAVMAHPLALPGELADWATARMQRASLAFIRGRLSVTGTTKISLLDVIELKGVGKRFVGRALVGGVGHRLVDGMWTTELQLGLPADGLVPDDGVDVPPASALIPPARGLQIGIVSAAQEKNPGDFTIKVKLPLLGDSVEVWARPMSPDAGKSRGYVFRPEVGDEVIVGFLADDPRFAVILGSLFSGKQTWPDALGKPTKENQKKGIVTRSGTTIGFLDEDKPSVFIETPAKNKVLLNDKDKLISLTDQHGNSVTLDDKGITLKSAKDIIVESKGSLTLKAQSSVAIEGQKVDVK